MSSSLITLAFLVLSFCLHIPHPARFRNFIGIVRLINIAVRSSRTNISLFQRLPRHIFPKPWLASLVYCLGTSPIPIADPGSWIRSYQQLRPYLQSGLISQQFGSSPVTHLGPSTHLYVRNEARHHQKSSQNIAQVAPSSPLACFGSVTGFISTTLA